MKYDPEKDDPFYWRYKKLVEDWTSALCEKLRLFGPSAENFKVMTAFFVKEIYKMGYKDAERYFLEVLEESKDKVVN